MTDKYITCQSHQNKKETSSNYQKSLLKCYLFSIIATHKIMIKSILNKYTITLILFLIWLLFFDKNDFFTQRDLNRQLKKLYEEKKYYQTEIQKNKNAIYELKNNIQSIEQFARERYWMKKDNEDVYVVLTKGKN